MTELGKQSNRLILNKEAWVANYQDALSAIAKDSVWDPERGW